MSMLSYAAKKHEEYYVPIHDEEEKIQMNKDIEYVSHLKTSMGMDINTFLITQERDGVFFTTGVDLKEYKNYLSIGVTRIPIKIDGREYDLDAEAGKLETKDGSVSIGGSSEFKLVCKELEERLQSSTPVHEHSIDPDIDI